MIPDYSLLALRDPSPEESSIIDYCMLYAWKLRHVANPVVRFRAPAGNVHSADADNVELRSIPVWEVYLDAGRCTDCKTTWQIVGVQAGDVFLYYVPEIRKIVEIVEPGA